MSYSSPRFSLHRPEDERYFEKVRFILSAPPCKGIPQEPDLVLPHVYIGNQRNAESLRLLRKYGITHVLNCAGYKGPRPEPNASPYQGLNIDYLEMQAEDIDSYDITQHFSQAFNYLDKVKRCGGVALVHCALGVNRSGAICAAYMMVSNHSTLLETIRTLKKKRNIILSNHGFQRQLVRYARAKGLLDDMEEAKDEFDKERLKIQASLQRHRDDMAIAQARPPVSSYDRFHMRRSDSFRNETDREKEREKRVYQLVGSYPESPGRPAMRYSSAGRRSHLSLPAALGSTSLASSDSIFERYMERTRSYMQ